jgi:cobaltochelatase CobT
MKKNKTLNNAFPIVAAALGNKFGVNVKVGGSDAFTDGKTINLPAYNLEDSSYKDVAWGYLAHEAAHVRFTDFTDFTNATTSPIRKSIVNILEDIRIEKSMIQIYPGTKLTIEKMDESICQTSDYQLVDKTSHPAAILSQFLFLRLSADVLGFSGLVPFADSVELALEGTFPVGAVTRLAGLLSEVPDLDSTRDCVRLADRILRMIEEEQEKEQEKAQQQSSDSEQDDQDQNQGEDSQQGGADSDDQSQDPQSGQGGVDSAGSNTDNAQNQDSEQLAQTLASVLSANEDDIPKDVFEIAQDILGGQASSSYDADVHMPIALEPHKNAVIGNAMLNKVLNESGKLRASLQGLVQANQNERPVNKTSGNRIDGRKLSRLAHGDPRVFERRTHKRKPNTAIHLLVDGSVSMAKAISQGIRLIDVAAESAMGVALALEGISGVNAAVTQFPSDNDGNVASLLKHGQKVRPNVSAFAARPFGSTPLHTALWYAAAAVLATREERKVIMVMTDGKPDDIDATRAIIERCEATGIELIGVGICYDTSHIFQRSICITDVSELRSEMFRISRDLLLAA